MCIVQPATLVYKQRTNRSVTNFGSNTETKLSVKRHFRHSGSNGNRYTLILIVCLVKAYN